jgi:hypothetical protein
MSATIYISNSGSDKNDGSTPQKPIFSWARATKLCKGDHEVHLMEGKATFDRLKREIESYGMPR